MSMTTKPTEARCVSSCGDFAYGEHAPHCPNAPATEKETCESHYHGARYQDCAEADLSFALSGAWAAVHPNQKAPNQGRMTDLFSVDRAAQEPRVARKVEERCGHGRYTAGNSHMKWCDDCGEIVHHSDAYGKPQGERREDWCKNRVIAWGCAAETRGSSKCAEWCGHNRGCPVTLKSREDFAAEQKKNFDIKARQTLTDMGLICIHSGKPPINCDCEEDCEFEQPAPPPQPQGSEEGIDWEGADASAKLYASWEKSVTNNQTHRLARAYLSLRTELAAKDREIERLSDPCEECGHIKTLDDERGLSCTVCFLRAKLATEKARAAAAEQVIEEIRAKAEKEYSLEGPGLYFADEVLAILASRANQEKG